MATATRYGTGRSYGSPYDTVLWSSKVFNFLALGRKDAESKHHGTQLNLKEKTANRINSRCKDAIWVGKQWNKWTKMTFLDTEFLKYLNSEQAFLTDQNWMTISEFIGYFLPWTAWIVFSHCTNSRNLSTNAQYLCLIWSDKSLT